MKKHLPEPIGRKTPHRVRLADVPASVETLVPEAVTPPMPEKENGAAMQVFDALPAKTKELVRLQDEAEKTCGPKAAALTRKIRTLGA